MGWTFLYMFVVLKLPIAFALWLIWWAARQDPAEQGEPRDDDGSDREPHPHRRGPRLPRGPRGPRRGGPHGAPPPREPRRVRAVAGRRRTHLY